MTGREKGGESQKKVKWHWLGGKKGDSGLGEVGSLIPRTETRVAKCPAHAREYGCLLTEREEQLQKDKF